jgi:hypothetical protein
MSYRDLKLSEIPDCCAVCGWFRSDEIIDCMHGLACSDEATEDGNLFGVCDEFQRITQWPEMGQAPLWCCSGGGDCATCTLLADEEDGEGQ